MSRPSASHHGSSSSTPPFERRAADAFRGLRGSGVHDIISFTLTALTGALLGIFSLLALPMPQSAEMVLSLQPAEYAQSYHAQLQTHTESFPHPLSSEVRAHLLYVETHESLEHLLKNPIRDEAALQNQLTGYLESIHQEIKAEEQERKGLRLRTEIAAIDRALRNARAEAKALQMRVQSYRLDLKPEDAALRAGQAERLKLLEAKQSEDRVARAALSKRISILDRLRKDLNDPVTDSLTGLNIGETPLTSALSQLRLTYIQGLEQLSTLETRYGEKHPLLQRLRSELEHIRDAIETEATAISQALQNERRVFDAQIDARAGEIENILKNRVVAQNDETELTAIESDMRRLRDRISAMEQRRTDLLIASEQPLQSLQLINAPQIKPVPYVAYATLFAGSGGLLALLFLNLIGRLRRFAWRNPTQQIERLKQRYYSFSGVHVMAVLPHTKLGKDRKLSDLIFSQPAEGLAEAVRQLRLSLKMGLSLEDSAPKAESSEAGQGTRKAQSNSSHNDLDHPLSGTSLAICSPQSSEGKTALSIWLGQISARAGERTIVIDCNLRAPNLHNGFGKIPSHSLVDYLGEQASLEDIIIRDDPSSVHVIWGEDVHKRAPDLLASKRMMHLLSALKKAYDLVIIDTPPLSTYPDGLLLADWADKVLLCHQDEGLTGQDHLAITLSKLRSHNLLEKTRMVLTNQSIPSSAFTAKTK